MITLACNRLPRHRKAERGVTLIETMIASVILMIGIGGLLSLLTVAVSQDSGQGDIATRAAVYAQGKMEQLLALSFNDGASNTTVYPTTSSGGTGLGGLMGGSATVGGINTASPVTNYVDYLDADALQTSAVGANFMRQWTISTNGAGNLKTITVLTTVVNWTGRGLAPSTRLVCTKSNNQ
ncbi:MAG: prepilin-type N-terminal cleavage/methylation domain-containing protein [Candidatus Acidiferrales bacterium]